MPKFIDLTGYRFGRLFVISRSANNKFNQTVWLCQCDCGKLTQVSQCKLRSNWTKSCGCLNREKIKFLNRSHGKWRSKEYNSWDGMIQRCDNKNHKAYKYYGGRGITYDPDWRLFENFYRDMGDMPLNKRTIDRINPNGNYTKDNCCWADTIQQSRTKRCREVSKTHLKGIQYDRRNNKYLVVSIK